MSQNSRKGFHTWIKIRHQFLTIYKIFGALYLASAVIDPLHHTNQFHEKINTVTTSNAATTNTDAEFYFISKNNVRNLCGVVFIIQRKSMVLKNMEQHRRLWLVLSGTLFFLCFHIFECEKLDGYEFPVYTTNVCPRNQTEWDERSSAINCNETNGYMCTPNQEFTVLLEFCYVLPFIWIQEGVCLYLYKDFSRVNGYNCEKFLSGCPQSAVASYGMFEYPNCSTIGNGCFLAEPSCESVDGFQENVKPILKVENTTKDKTGGDNSSYIIFAAFAGLITFIFILSYILCLLHQRLIKEKKNLRTSQLGVLEERSEGPEQILNHRIEAKSNDTKNLSFQGKDVDTKEEELIKKDSSETVHLMVGRDSGKNAMLEDLQEAGSIYIPKQSICGIKSIAVACESGLV